MLQEEQDAGRQGETEAKPEAVCTASDQGLTITASEVYSDGYSIYLAVEVESEEGGFSNISPALYETFLKKSPARCSRRPEAGGPEKEKRTS